MNAPSFVANRGATVTLSGAYVAVGNLQNNADYFDTGYASPNAPSVLDPTTGGGTLLIDAQLIDIRGVSGWNGFGTETFQSTGDIRLIASQNPIFAPPSVGVPGNPGFEGALNTSGMLQLQAAQIYPTTFTVFAINDLPVEGMTAPAATVVSISTPSAAHAIPATPLSAGGSVTINATEIDQSGVLRAPMGQIALNAESLLDAQGNVLVSGRVNMTDGSMTSVSAGTSIIPYGTTANGSQWTYSPAPGYTDVVAQAPAKQIALTGATVNVDSGAKIDLSGGGDLYAYEFIAGQGGSVDVLDQASLASSARAPGTPVYSYAILPGLGSPFAAIDAQYSQSSTTAANQTITLSGIPGLAPGSYALLPAHYALLPGAYAVDIIDQNSGVLPGPAVEQSNGAYVAAGRLGVAGTDILSSITSTILVASSATVRTQSQYSDSYANAFFSAAAAAAAAATPSLPANAGQLLLAADSILNLNGSIDFAAGSFTASAIAGAAPTKQQGIGGDVVLLEGKEPVGVEGEYRRSE